MNIENTTLYAPMRIAGIQAEAPLSEVHSVLTDLWTRWQDAKASRLPSFTLTVYCVYQYNDTIPDKVLITIGRIVAQDMPLPEFAQEAILPAQDYRCYEVPDMRPDDIFKTWLLIENDETLPRSFTTDFETYPLHGLPKIYAGIQAA
ncbi:GyrI-like domain-containing protein [Neisseriaceae bacterium B1]